MHLLRTELRDIMQLWNTHYIRKSRNEDAPHGKPDIMYYMPELFGGRDCLLHVDEVEVAVASLSDLLTIPPPTCQDDYTELFRLLMTEGGMTPPTTIEEADDLLVYLLDSVEFYLGQM